MPYFTCDRDKLFLNSIYTMYTIYTTCTSSPVTETNCFLIHLNTISMQCNAIPDLWQRQIVSWSIQHNAILNLWLEDTFHFQQRHNVSLSYAWCNTWHYNFMKRCNIPQSEIPAKNTIEDFTILFEFVYVVSELQSHSCIKTLPSCKDILFKEMLSCVVSTTYLNGKFLYHLKIYQTQTSFFIKVSKGDCIWFCHVLVL